MSARLLVSIVTYNSDRYLETCIESLKLQTFHDYTIAVWDNASTDETRAIIARYRDLLGATFLSEENVGFSTAHNRLIESTASDYVLVLNPDVFIDPAFSKT